MPKGPNLRFLNHESSRPAMRHLKMKRNLFFIVAMLLAFLSFHTNAQTATQARPRIIVTADPELDDNNSLIRFLLYSSDLNIEGLVYASSGFHWKGDGK